MGNLNGALSKLLVHSKTKRKQQPRDGIWAKQVQYVSANRTELDYCVNKLKNLIILVLEELTCGMLHSERGHLKKMWLNFWKPCIAKYPMDEQCSVYNWYAVNVGKWWNATLLQDRVNLPQNRPSFINIDVDSHVSYFDHMQSIW